MENKNHMHITQPDIERYSWQHSQTESAIIQELIQFTEEKFPGTPMLSGRLVGNTLALLCRLMHAEKILEIGTFTGYSALCMAEACMDDAVIISMDKDPTAFGIAKYFCSQSEHGHKIRLHLGEAVNLLDKVSKNQPFDLIFIDADKGNYMNYYHDCLPLVRQNGLLIFDNALWYGRVLQPEKNTDQVIHQLNEQIMADHRVDHVLLPVRDGLHIVRKK